MKMLALEVEFLLGRYVASDFRDRERAEWPPHPSRLFSALVAAAYESGLGESARAALLWLESLLPPCLCADEHPYPQTPVTVYVPVNDPTEDLLPQRAERQPRSFPSTVPPTPVVYFVWPEAQPDTVLRQLLEAITRSVSYLGSSRSPVRVRLSDKPPAPNWFPDDAGEVVLRVPREGRLESLDWHFQNGQRPAPGAFQRYRCGPRRQTKPAPESAFGDMVIYRLGGPVQMEIETTLKLTDVLRAAAMKRAQEAGGAVPEVLSGHDEQGRPLARTHAAFVTLPFVSDTQEHADGRVMGVAVLLPRDIPTEERRRVARALSRVDHLLVPGVGRLELERLLYDQPPPVNLRPTTWTGPRRRWASVTPVLLDRFPRRNGRGIEKVIAKSCEYIGLPRPIEVVADHHSPLHGVEPSFRFITRRAGTDRARLYTHVVLTFGQDVRGPILLGAGRYFGLGLLRPLQEDQP
jgi:CRISPR-associated protein Csb2